MMLRFPAQCPMPSLRFVNLEQALVGNLPYSIQENHIAEFFYDCGVTDIFLVRDRETGEMKVKKTNTDRHRPVCAMLASSPQRL